MEKRSRDLMKANGNGTHLTKKMAAGAPMKMKYLPIRNRLKCRNNVIPILSHVMGITQPLRCGNYGLK